MDRRARIETGSAGRRFVTALCALAVVCGSDDVWADPAQQATAQALFDEGKRLIVEGRYAEACPKLEESQRLDPAVGTQGALAACYERIGRTASAWSIYLDVIAAAKKAGDREREHLARLRVSEIEPTLSRLTITVAGTVPGLRVERDGMEVGVAQLGSEVPVDPGPHTIVAAAPGRIGWRATVEVRGNGRVEIPPLADVATAVTPAGATPTPQRIWALVAGGAGVTGMGIGIALGLSAKSTFDDAEARCHGSICDSEGVELRAAAVARGDVATGFFVVGSVLVAGGGVLWLSTPAQNLWSLGAAPGRIVARASW